MADFKGRFRHVGLMAVLELAFIQINELDVTWFIIARATTM